MQIICPQCHEMQILPENHMWYVVESDGIVWPIFVCGNYGCDYMHHIRLGRWTD